MMITEVKRKLKVKYQKQDQDMKTGAMLRDSSDKKIAERLASIPKKYRQIYEKAMQGKSRKAGIDAFCLECLGWKRKDIEGCSSTACSLYHFRPYQKTR